MLIRLCITITITAYYGLITTQYIHVWRHDMLSCKYSSGLIKIKVRKMDFHLNECDGVDLRSQIKQQALPRSILYV